MKVSVTQLDINFGVKRSSICCPIALAVRCDNQQNVRIIRVYPTWMRVGDWRFDLPEKARDFISAFDKGEPVSPIEFDMGPPMSGIFHG